MKKLLAFLLSAALLLSITACAGKKDDDGVTSKPTSEPSASQDDNSQDDNSQGNNSEDNNSQGNNSQGNNSQGNNSQGNNSQGNNSQGNNSQGGGQTGNQDTPPVTPTDLTVYVPYSADIDKNNSQQYFPPTLGQDGSLSPGMTVETTQFEAPEIFEAKKAINAFKNESASVTAAKLQEYISKYADAYNKHYNDSNYELSVSISGNTVKYTYTITGEPAERSDTVIKLLLNGDKGHFNKYADFYNDFYKDQIKSYKAAVSSISKIEICIVRAKNDPLFGTNGNILSKTFS